MDAYSIGEITKADKDEIITLHKRYLNYGAGVEKYISNLFKSNSCFGYKFISEGKICGIALFEKGIVFTVPHPELKQKISSDFPDSEIYSLASYIVCKEYSGHHIGNSLIRRCIDRISDGRSQKLVVEMWVHPDKDVPASGLEKLLPSHKNYGLFRDFYKNQDQYDFYCPICGEKCICGAQIVVFDINKI